MYNIEKILYEHILLVEILKGASSNDKELALQKDKLQYEAHKPLNQKYHK